MKVKHHIGESGKVIVEYVAENEADREELAQLVIDGKASPAQREPDSIGTPE